MAAASAAPAIPVDKLHTEEAVELHFVEQLVRLQGWREHNHESYDRASALDPDLTAEFVRTTQPEAWSSIERQYPGRAEAELARQVAARLKAVGTLEVLRTGLTIVPGIKIILCGFRPASGLNPDLEQSYESNILSVMRQVHYSEKHPKRSIDIVLFVNGIPVTTVEAKNTLTGTRYKDAEKQYRTTRSPKGEPLLTFKRGTLVHLALDQNTVSMTTKLANGGTRFLPFNRGFEGGAGNPDLPEEFRIAYLYRDIDGQRAVFSREVLLEIIAQFCLVIDEPQKDGKRKQELIWPRFHQLEAVRRVVADARARGTGQNYLFQHSAGSGKSNTIAWTAHSLAKLHDAEDRPVFHAVVIVSDRLIIDSQLQETVKAFEQTPGYVQAIDGTSRQLRNAIEDGARIIISTIQKFATDQMSVLASQADRRFAILVDEAHSSQSGRSADSMAGALGDAEVDIEHEKELDAMEAELLKRQRIRGPQANLSYLAFTATPRNVTLERFGEKDAEGMPNPFHLYSMRQAIEEGFILDVLQNYRTYDAFYKIESAIDEDPRLRERRSQRKVARFANLHETAMAQKAEIVVEHFRKRVLPEINGQAKAMVVTSSIEHAIRTFHAIQSYLAEEGYRDVSPLIAFSGEKKVDGETYSEPKMNGFSERELRRRFDGPDYNLLVVAEKYQTGFDQPKLVAMYIDKKLAGLQAVQTLSRLNRILPPEKERTYILDFRNCAEEIQEAFSPYFNATHLEDTSDPNEVYNLKARLEAAGVLSHDEITHFVETLLGTRGAAADRPVLEGLVRPAVERFRDLPDDETREEFRQLLSSFLRFYSFVAQIVNLQDTDLERLHLYGAWLFRMLPDREAPEGHDVTDDMLRLAAFRLKDHGEAEASLPADTEGKLQPISRFGANPYTEEEQKTLSEIIEAFNARHGTNFSEEEFVRFRQSGDEILADEDMRELLARNDPELTISRFEREFFRRMVKSFQRDNVMRNAFMQDPEARKMVTALEHQRAVRLAREHAADAA